MINAPQMKDCVLRHCRDARCSMGKNDTVHKKRRVFQVAANNRCSIDGNKSGSSVMSCYRDVRYPTE